MMVEAIRQATCMQFKLNRDQECVLNEVTKWFLARANSPQKIVQEFDEITGIMS
jgi:hypothetical protein